MAIKWLEKGEVWNSSPPFIRNVGYEEVSRDSKTVSFKVHLEIKINRTTSDAFYGYPIYWEINDGTDYKIKGTEKWYGGQDYRRFTINLKANVSEGKGEYSAKIRVWATSGGTMTFTKSYKLAYSAYNTAPSFPEGSKLVIRLNDSSGDIITDTPDVSENKIKIPENATKFHLSWSAAEDVDNNIAKYEVWTQSNGSSWSKISTQTSSREFTHTVPGGSATQGHTYDYYIKVIDEAGASAKLDSSQFQKNELTPAKITKITKITHDISEATISYNPAINTYENDEFTYELKSEHISIHNGSNFNGVLKVVDTKDTVTDTYILRNELYNYLKDSNYKGNIPIILVSKNIYGSSATSSYNMPVDLQTPPNPPTSIVLSEKTSTNLGEFIIPDKNKVRLTYEGATDPLNGDLIYSVSYSVDNGDSFIDLIKETPNTSVLLDLPVVKKATEIIIKVDTKSSVTNKSVSKELRGEVIHYYNNPSVTLLNPVRTSNSFNVEVKTVLNSSIPEIDLGEQTYTGFSNEPKTFTGLHTTIVDEGLTEDASYNLYVSSNDNTGLSNSIVSIWVNQAKPVLSVRESGVGVGCVNDGVDSLDLIVGNGLKVGGNTLLENLDVNNLKVKSNVTVSSLTTTELTSTNANLTGEVNIRGFKFSGDRVYVGDMEVLGSNPEWGNIWLNGKGAFKGTLTKGYSKIVDKDDESKQTVINPEKITMRSKEVLSVYTWLHVNHKHGFETICLWGDISHKPPGTTFEVDEDFTLVTKERQKYRTVKKGEKLKVLNKIDEYYEVEDDGKVYLAPQSRLNNTYEVKQRILDEYDNVVQEFVLNKDGIHCNDLFTSIPQIALLDNTEIKDKLFNLIRKSKDINNNKVSQSEINTLLLQSLYSLLSK